MVNKPAMHFLYTVIRVVPNPVNGEFVNLGVMVTDEHGDDTCVLVADSDRHLLRLAPQYIIDAARDMVHGIRQQRVPFTRLDRLRARHRNVVQFSEPLPVACDTATEGATLLFKHLILED